MRERERINKLSVFPAPGRPHLDKLEEDEQVRVDLELATVLLNHGHDLLHDLGVPAGVDREPRGWGEVGMLLQGHRLVDMVLGGGREGRWSLNGSMV